VKQSKVFFIPNPAFESIDKPKRLVCPWLSLLKAKREEMALLILFHTLFHTM